MVCASYGMDTDVYSVPYVASWSSSVVDSTPVDVIRPTGERVRKAALGILDTLPEPPLGDGTPPGLERSPSISPDRISRASQLSSVSADLSAPGGNPVGIGI